MYKRQKLVITEPKDSLNERIGNYSCKEGIDWKISRKENGLVLRYKEPHQKKFSAPIHLYRTVQGHYIMAELEPDTLDFIFSSHNGIKQFLFYKYGGTKMLLEKND